MCFPPASRALPLLPYPLQPGIFEEPEADSPSQLVKMLTAGPDNGLPPGGSNRFERYVTHVDAC